MPRNPEDVAVEKIVRRKDQVRRIEGQLADARHAAGREMLAYLEACEARGTKGARSRMAVLWSTSLSQVDRMIARARTERR